MNQLGQIHNNMREIERASYPVANGKGLDEGFGRRTAQAYLLGGLDLRCLRIVTRIGVGDADRQGELDLELLLEEVEIDGILRRRRRFPSPRRQCRIRRRRRGRRRRRREGRRRRRRRIHPVVGVDVKLSQQMLHL